MVVLFEMTFYYYIVGFIQVGTIFMGIKLSTYAHKLSASSVFPLYVLLKN